MDHRADSVITDSEIGSDSTNGDVCPVTGLPIVRRPAWTEVQIADNYWTTIKTIGGNILHVKPWGYATRDAVLRVTDLQDAIIEEIIGTGVPLVHIADYTNMKGATFEARRTFANRVKQRPGVLAFIVYGASPLFTLAVKLAQRFRFISFDVGIVPDYVRAVRSAVEILRLADVDGLPAQITPTQPAIEAKPGSASLELEHVHLEYEVIDGRIIHGSVRGHAGIPEIEKAIEFENLMLSSIDASSDEMVIIADMTDLEGVTGPARRIYVANLRSRHSTSPISLFICYGVSPAIRSMINVSRPFVPFRVRVARDRSTALEIARRDTDGGPISRIKLALFHGKHTPSATRPAEVEQLLRLISNIDWERDGPAAPDPAISHGHPLAPVVEALELIKAELDDVFRIRRQTETALRESEERYRDILENIADGYYEIDLQGQLQFFNDELLRIFKFQRTDSEIFDATALMDSDNRAVAMDHFRNVLETGEPAHVTDFEMMAKDGTPVHVETSISLIRDQDGEPTGYRGIIRDITERIRTAEDKASLEAQLRRSQRMEAIGTLAGGIAHNFNNLLMGIQGNVSLLLQEMATDNQLIKRLKTIEALVDGGSKLTSQLLGYARSGRVDVRVINLNQLVLDTAETFSLTRKEFRVHTNLTEQTLPVEVDPAQIEQAFLNLLINAADAMPRGGDIYLTSKSVPQEEITGPRDELKDGDFALIAVRDTGCGMEATTIDRAFEPFFTTKGMTGGTGLGLASAYGIVRAHGGRIDIDSTVGEGSTMSILLPAVGGSLAAGAETAAGPVKGEGTILVVDDNPEVLEACASMLELLQYTPICAGSGRAAVEIFDRRKHDIDLVILDLILTDLSGGEVFDRIKDMDPGARVLLASGYSLDGEAAGILDRGCNDFIQKPFTLEQLSIKLDHLIRQTSEF